MNEPGAESKGPKRWFSGWGKGSGKLQTETRQCPNGHPMAMDWVDCPYCAANERSGSKTRTSMPPSPPLNTAETSDAAPSAPTRRQTVAFGASAADASAPPADAAVNLSSHAAGKIGGHKPTSVFDTGPAGANAPQRGHLTPGGRRITGVIYTFSWSNLGQLFEIRDGRNFVGSSTVALEGDRPCDVLVQEDGRMSSAHFMILCQGGRYMVKDHNSTNGTYVDGELIDSLGIELKDGAVIKAGDTLFAFQKVAPPDADRPATDDPRDEEPEEMPRRRSSGEGGVL